MTQYLFLATFQLQVLEKLFQEVQPDVVINTSALSVPDYLSLIHILLVADVMMPRMDGFEMVRRIRQTDKQTPVLFLTARGPRRSPAVGGPR